MRKVALHWIGNLQFVAADDNKHSLVIDTKQEVGGNETGFQPIDLLLVSLAGCMAMDIVSILRKKHLDLKSLVFDVEGERATEHPKRFTKILLKIKSNEEIPRLDLERAVELSRDKYCSVFSTLKNPPEIFFQMNRGEE